MLVLGAGIVGLTSAWALRQRGCEVTVIDQGEPGSGATGGNGAQLSYAYVQPLADPGLWAQLPKLLLEHDSPLRWRPSLDTAQWAWCLRFLLACRRSVSQQTTRELLALAAESRAGYARLWPQLDAPCDTSTTGKLVLYPNAASMAAAQTQLRLQRSLGCEQQALSPAECVAVEPALAGYSGPWVGGIHTPGEGAVDGAALCQALHRLLKRQGVRFVLGHAVTRLHTGAGGITSVVTRDGLYSADAVVIALGAESARLASRHGWHLPVYPLKGYSVTLPAHGRAAPQVNVTDLSRKVVFARLGERLRVAGMVEIAGHQTEIDPARIASLLDSTRRAFPDLSIDPQGPVQPWAGLRPATPTGRPITGRWRGAPVNLWFNTGHGALGLTLAMGSAERLARLMTNSEA